MAAATHWRILVDGSPAALIALAHAVRHAGATEPELLRGCSEPAVRIQIQGESFMVHQIRHMVGAAVAVARGDLPAAVIPASLRVESRITRELPGLLLPLFGSASVHCLDVTPAWIPSERRSQSPAYAAAMHRVRPHRCLA